MNEDSKRALRRVLDKKMKKRSRKEPNKKRNGIKQVKEKNYDVMKEYANEQINRVF